MTVVDSTPVVTEEQVLAITQDVWESFLVLRLEQHPLAEAAPPLAGPTVTGCVHITGEWDGSVFLQVGAGHAQAAAEAMFGADPGSLSESEVSDALGELTNMVGGNIKSLVPAPSKLSLPSVSEGENYTVRVPGAVLLSRVALLCGDAPVLVSVWKA